MDLKDKLHTVPPSSGVYIMKDARERVIYVGKAKNLKERLKSYFQESSSSEVRSELDLRKSAMVKEIKDFDYIVTDNELEALVLEANYIKGLKPRYNIILRDDKNYPYLKLTVNEEWPRLEVARRITKDGSLSNGVYFGPYVPTGIMWETLRFIRRNFPLRQCRYNLEKPMRPCIQYQMGRCLAPCAETLRGRKEHKRYMEVVNEVRLFLQGKRKDLLENLLGRMQRLSDDLRFEEAARLRDRIKAIERVWETQRVIAQELGDMDVIGIYRKEREGAIFVLFVRNGMVSGQKDFFLRRLDGMDNREVITGFIGQFYSKDMLIPPRIVLPIKGYFKTQRLWLSKKRGGDVRLSYAKGEKEIEVMRMAKDNAYHSFLGHKETKTDEVLILLKNLLNLKTIPRRIEALDVSNIAGSEAVGAVVTWEDGEFLKDGYRLFKIKGVEGIDDFAMIEEVMARHLSRMVGTQGSELPQLILIDGGRGQLNSALNAMKPFNLLIEIAAIAKAKEGEIQDRVYLPGKTAPVLLEPGMAVTNLLQRIRDEAHRFAIGHHKRLRTRRTLESPLERVSGIGKKRRLLLLRHFGGIDALKKASLDEIASLKGINRKIAERLKQFLGCVLSLFLLSLPISSEAAYKVYLKNGSVLSGVDELREEDGRIIIYTGGGSLTISKESVLRIEEYKAGIIKKREPPKEEPPMWWRVYETAPPEKLEEPKKPQEKELKKEAPEQRKRTAPRKTQYKELKKLEEEGKLPPTHKPYKEFLDKLERERKLAP